MSDARAEVLQRITAATVGVSVGDVPRGYATRGVDAPGTGPVVALFAERTADYKATVMHCTTDDSDVAAVVAEALAARGLRSCLLAPGLADMVSALPGAAVDDGSLGWRELDAVPAVVTGSVAAMADTGTIVLDGSPRCGRRALSLVPDVHVCLVRASDVHANVPEALAVVDRTAPLTMISGPSATSDIELHRVEGVHGPRTLIVVIVGSPVRGAES